MQLSLRQMGGMVFYETRLVWRRRVLALVLVGVLGLLLVTSQMIARTSESFEDGESESVALSQSGLTAEAVERVEATLLVMFGTWPVVMIALAVAVPIVTAEAIPMDQQLGVRELLDSLPIERAVYLSGKLLGTWASLLAGLAAVAGVSGLANRLLYGPYEAGGFLLIWLYLLPLAFLASGLALTLAAGQPNRRRAVGLAVVLVIGLLLLPIVAQPGTWRASLSPINPVGFMDLQVSYLVQAAPALVQAGEPMGTVGPLSPPSLPLTTAVVAGQVVLAWLGAWGWLRWQEGR